MLNDDNNEPEVSPDNSPDGPIDPSLIIEVTPQMIKENLSIKAINNAIEKSSETKK